METQENMIKTALQAAQKPFFEFAPNNTLLVFTPDQDGGWRYKSHPELMQNPYRKCGKFLMHDTASLIKFVQKHKQDGTQIYIDADFKSGRIDVTAVINGHTQQAPGWLDFYAVYTPQHTTSASNWLNNNAHRMNQMEFSHFLTNNARNIVSKNPGNENSVYPTAAEVLDFALNLEYTEKTTFKQGYREQDGRINFTFQSEDSGQTEKNLKMFERFGIEFTPHQGGASYFVEALLKFRIDKNSGALVLWYELQQIDAVIEQAAKDISEAVQKAFPEIDIYFGVIA
ncbi:TPA: YfdQ family protein [Neisseria meningitidis]|jgi:Uncharacterized conserved protein|uniref:Phage associated protein n=2 Tax=Neisseria meningitidis TaxID=487 RepID=A0A0H5QRQ1_NEIMI|nr:YfdQ family protein [Neisseria meningitidis]CCA44912.1 conserved hypothetical protein [Neisseria meningitidis alpha522]ADZ01714.1 conserved hypothetical protein [Neisseria meningitidis M04-240196]EGC56611.1 hypothetical protein NMBM13399_1287 [Neisseria meningitidis M13399]EGC66606.1 hypothetical protein NMBM01240013_1302 [Neisseria meningitidis M01-240013]EJU80337.1 hypothetical protein NMEN3081_0995 [Neisseria meningitidis NM3081]